MRLEYILVVCGLFAVVYHLAREGIYGVVDQTAESQRRGVRLSHKLIGGGKAGCVEVLDHQKSSEILAVELLAVYQVVDGFVHLPYVASVVGYYDYLSVVVNAVLAQIVKPSSELQHGSHIRLIVRYLALVLHFQLSAVNHVAVCQLIGIGGVVNLLLGRVIRHLEHARLMSRVV